MNYNSKNKVYSTRYSFDENKILTRKTNADKDSTNNSQHQSKIMKLYLSGKLIPIAQNLQEEKLKLQIEKLKLENQYLGIRIGFRENLSKPKATITMKKELYIENNSGTGSIRSPYDSENKRLQCIDCMCMFTWENKLDFIDQIGEFQRHLVSEHNREMTTLESDVIMKLQYEGEST